MVNTTKDLLIRIRELLADIQVELTMQALNQKPQGPRKRAIKAKINGGGK